MEHAFRRFAGERLVAPPLLWSEVRSTLHYAVWRGLVSPAAGLRALDRLERSPIRPRQHARLGRVAWEVSDLLGWSKTYDAEYLALARLLRCPLVTLDARMLAAAERLGVDARPPSL